jgi:hypothetical protein
MEKCTRCGKPLTGDVITMELSNTDGNYYLSSIPPGHVSQGGFPFGKDCAVLQSIETTLALSKQIDELYQERLGN